MRRAAGATTTEASTTWLDLNVIALQACCREGAGSHLHRRTRHTFVRNSSRSRAIRCTSALEPVLTVPVVVKPRTVKRASESGSSATELNKHCARRKPSVPAARTWSPRGHPVGPCG